MVIIAANGVSVDLSEQIQRRLMIYQFQDFRTS